MSALDSDKEHFELMVRNLADRMIDLAGSLWSITGMGFFKVFKVEEFPIRKITFDVMVIDTTVQVPYSLHIEVYPEDLLRGSNSGLLFVDSAALLDETMLADMYGFEPARPNELGLHGFFIRQDELAQILSVYSERERDQLIIEAIKNFGLKVSAYAMFVLHAAPMLYPACLDI